MGVIWTTLITSSYESRMHFVETDVNKLVYNDNGMCVSYSSILLTVEEALESF